MRVFLFFDVSDIFKSNHKGQSINLILNNTENKYFSKIDKFNSNKKFFVPTHEIEGRDLGRLKLFNEETPFEEFSAATATSYIEMQGDPSSGYQLIDLIYPYVLDTPGKIDPGSMNGVIEPLSIRDYATKQTIDRPDAARRPRASLGSAHEDPFGYSVLIEQRRMIANNDPGIRPYMEYGDDSNRPIEQKTGYFAEDPTGKSPFKEKTKELELKTLERIKEENRIHGKVNLIITKLNYL